MTVQSKFKNSLTSLLLCFAPAVWVQTAVAQLESGLVVTASDDATFLGQTLFPDSVGTPFRFDSAFLDFGLEGAPFTIDDDGFAVPGEIEPTPVGTLPTIGTFINNSAVFGIGDPGNTVATGIAISSGLVESFSGGPNFSGSTTGSFGTFEPLDPLDPLDPFGPASGVNGPTASAEQTSLLTDLSPAAGGVFQDTTSLSINFTNVTQTDQVLDLFAVFGTEETPDFTGLGFNPFNDAFGVFLNGENIALQDNLPLNVDHPNQRPVFGTELDTFVTSNGPDGVIRPYVDLTTTVGTGQHELTVVLGDASDDVFDSTAFLSRDVSDQPVAGVALAPDTITEDGNFQFEGVSVEADEPIFIGSDIAFGYQYSVEEVTAEEEALFGTVRVDPTDFNSFFTISYEDENGTVVSEPLAAGETFVFPESVDVSSFEILDIDTFLGLPTGNPLAFATLLTFRNDLNNATIIQAPISLAAVPEPSSTFLLVFGGAAALLRRQRR